ncbi:MAG TPA: archease [Chitinophagaceae bacterium]|nr:archease [Chitinophagaceae bacterium]
MPAFKILPHTADVRLQVTGLTLEELFRSALKGMGHLQKKDFCEEEKTEFSIEEKIKVRSTDQTSLLIDFLSEALTSSHINKVIYCQASFDKLSATEVSATIKGDRVDYFEEDIKAVTYHEAEIIENEDLQLETVVIFDI